MDDIDDPLMPSAELLNELHGYLDRDPARRKLLDRQPDEPEIPAYELLIKGSSPYYIVQVQMPERDGAVWASRLPGLRPVHAELEWKALQAFGIQRVVCLVPASTLVQRHGAYNYAQLAQEHFRDSFHQVEIHDHQVPAADAPFAEAVLGVDEALKRGEQVLVHCVGGCGRTGMFTACLMIEAGLSPEQAIRTFRRFRRCGPETPEQVAYVFRYADLRQR